MSQLWFRNGIDPATGEAIKIPAKTVVKMRVAKAAKEAIVPGRKQREKGEALVLLTTPIPTSWGMLNRGPLHTPKACSRDNPE